MSKSHTVQVQVVVHGPTVDKSYHAGCKCCKDAATRAVAVGQAGVAELLEKLVGGRKPKQ